MAVGHLGTTSWSGWLQGDGKDVRLVSVLEWERGVETAAGTGGGVGGGKASSVVRWCDLTGKVKHP